MDIQEEITLALTKGGLVDVSVELETTATGRTSGVVVSSSFADQSEYARQEMMWRILDRALPHDTRHRVLLLTTWTPAELEEERAGDLEDIA